MEYTDNQVSHDAISGLSKGDINSFKIVYSSHFKRVFNFASRFSLSKEDAEEVVQDVFIKLWEKRTIIDPNKNLCSFLYTIAQNLVIDKIRKYVATEKKMAIFNANGVKTYSSESTEQLVNFYELSDILTKLINDLPSRRRAIFKLSREKCLTNKEISDVLKISQGTVEKQMSKALLTLKAVLKSKYGIFIDLFILLPLFAF